MPFSVVYPDALKKFMRFMKPVSSSLCLDQCDYFCQNYSQIIRSVLHEVDDQMCVVLFGYWKWI
jgi:hypothetical protein